MLRFNARKDTNYSPALAHTVAHFRVRYSTPAAAAEADLPAQFSERIDDYIERIGQQLDAVLPPAKHGPEQLHEAMRYAVLNGGKRIRPLLVYAAGECLDVPDALLDAPATAIELIHAFSLVHDDLPAMDNDDLRRGMPTLHRRFDEATAILAADALQPLAFSVLANIDAIPAESRTRLVGLIADACGSIGMTGGQSMDLAAEGHTLSAGEIESMYSLKTGALIHASIMSVALLCSDLSAARTTALDAFARSVGIAFQIKDDILDVVGETAVIGKQTGADQRLGKATYPGLFGIDVAQSRCDELLQHSLDQLNAFDSDADSLRWLARFIVERGN
ncbi:MAG: polyprenyl synthetase family protein [Proteobacteria bacterium]|nr:polyprenyl synthetase family protein [Pseudomonadota bacterium]